MEEEEVSGQNQGRMRWIYFQIEKTHHSAPA